MSRVDEADAGWQRLREAFTAAPADARPGAHCPPPESIWSAASGELVHEETRRLAGHAVSCRSCATAWSLARDLATQAGAGERAAVEPPVAAGRRSWLGWWVLAAAAAGLATVVAVLNLRQAPPPSSVPGFREPASELVRSLIPPDAILPREECVLRWSGPDNARYDLRVATGDLRVLATMAGLEATEYQVPAEVLAELPGGSRLVWQVKAVLPDGTLLPSRSFVTRLE